MTHNIAVLIDGQFHGVLTLSSHRLLTVRLVRKFRGQDNVQEIRAMVAEYMLRRFCSRVAPLFMDYNERRYKVTHATVSR